MGPKTLHVRPVTPDEIGKQWGVPPLSFRYQEAQYARCTATGKINWDTTSVYGQKELETKPKVKILLKETLSKKEIIEKIKSLSGNIKGVYKTVYKVADEKGQIDQFAFDVAQQANTNKLTRQGTEKAVGTEIVLLSLELYPNVKLGDQYSKKI